MKSILTVCVFVMISTIAYSQDTPCIEEYRKLREGPPANKFTKDWIHLKEAQFNKINSSIKACKGDEKAWKVLYDTKWKSFNVFTKDRVSAQNRNNGDIEKIESRWITLLSEISVYEDIIFDEAFVKKKVTDIEVTQKTNETNRASASTQTQNKIGEVVSSVDKVKSEVGEVNKSVNEVKSSVNDVNASVEKASEKLEAVQTTTTHIRDFLLKRDTTIRHILSLSGHGNNIYGVGFLHVIDSKKNKPSPITLMAEMVFPLQSRGDGLGFFAAGGVQNRSIAVLVGPGLLYDEITWKGNLIYFPSKSFAGFGVSYSPLTDFGIALTINPAYKK